MKIQEHGINPSAPVIPDHVFRRASNIATKCNQKLGIVSGIDFILNKSDNK